MDRERDRERDGAPREGLLEADLHGCPLPTWELPRRTSLARDDLVWPMDTSSSPTVASRPHGRLARSIEGDEYSHRWPSMPRLSCEMGLRRAHNMKTAYAYQSEAGGRFALLWWQCSWSQMLRVCCGSGCLRIGLQYTTSLVLTRMGTTKVNKVHSGLSWNK